MQNPQVKDKRSPNPIQPIGEAHFSLGEHFMLPQSTSDYLARGFKVMQEIKLMIKIWDWSCFRGEKCTFLMRKTDVGHE